MNNEIKNPIPPTVTDLKILEFMNTGNYIDDERGRAIFNSYGLRDSIYRLRKAGHEIKDRWVFYMTKSGSPKKYKQWFTRELVIMPHGEKTEQVPKSNFLPKHADPVSWQQQLF